MTLISVCMRSQGRPGASALPCRLQQKVHQAKNAAARKAAGLRLEIRRKRRKTHHVSKECTTMKTRSGLIFVVRCAYAGDGCET